MSDGSIAYRDRPYDPPVGDRGPNPNGGGQVKRKRSKYPPQENVKRFWDKFNTKYPGKVFTILPDDPHARIKAAKAPKGAVQQRAARSYEEARAQCERNVHRIIKECRRVNQKYRDPHFDIEWDLKSGRRNCLDGLAKGLQGGSPKGVKRVTDVFEKPQFYINGPTAGDVRQGRDGDCYLMAALCGLGNMEGLIGKVCVARDEKVGVYGFVFHRDGEWQQCIVDDKLYLRAPDYDEAQEERVVWDDINRGDTEGEWRRVHQTGSRALYFASCSDENETWLPLLEKAWAKAHGDYASIDGGFTGEAIEDLTGGVTSEFYSTDILDKDEFWNNQLLKVGKEFLFGCATGFYSNWLDRTGNAPQRERQGISEQHAYSIMDAVEIEGQRLVKLRYLGWPYSIYRADHNTRNPWGRKEWDGKWSDGSKEWTSLWMERLKHEFGNDGVFWIHYDDLLKKYQHFDRTRIFGPEWHITQQWTSIHVPWSADYHSTRFKLTLQKESAVVIVLSQLDETYFQGLEGAYTFDLQFRIEKEGDEEDDYIVRSHENYVMNRSVNTDITLEAGVYSILMKITARTNNNLDIEEVLPTCAETRREKLIQIGLSYDMAHAKGLIVETEEEKSEREAREKARKVEDRAKMKKEIREQAQKTWTKRKAMHKRNKARQAKKEKTDARRAAQGRSPDDEDDNADSMDVADGSEKENEDQLAAVKPFFGQIVQIRGGPRVAGQGPGDDAAAPAEEQISMQDAILEDLASTGRQEHNHTVKESGPEAEQDAIATAVSQNVHPIHPSLPIRAAPAAENLAQPLSEVLAAADAASPTITNNLPIPQSNGTTTTITNIHPIPTPAPLAPAEADLNPPHDHHPYPSALTNILLLPDAPGSPSPSSSSSSSSSTTSFPPFDYDTDLDLDLSSSDNDNNNNHHHNLHDLPRPTPTKPAANNLANDLDDLDTSESDSDREPWNAVCVVGLRVYSLVSGADLRLEVVRPGLDHDHAEDDEGVGNGEKQKKQMQMHPETVLDRDDPAKGAEGSGSGTGVVVMVEVNGDGDGAGIGE